MANISTTPTSCLMIVRLNNFGSIKAAFGEQAALGAVAHVRDRIASQLATFGVTQVVDDEIELVFANISQNSFPTGALFAALCGSSGLELYRCGDETIILSLSAGTSMMHHFLSYEASYELARGDAHAQLEASSCKPDGFTEWGTSWAAQYRADMAAGALLLEQVQSGEAFFAWRSVRSVADLSKTLHAEGDLRRIGERGERMSCEEGYKALERLELSHLVDQLLVSLTLDELERDPRACVCVPVSALSLSFNLHGKATGWTDLQYRLQYDPALARRLVIEIDETSPLLSVADARDFVSELRSYGVRFALSRFGSGHAYVGQLIVLEPDMVKLDGAFLRTAFQSASHSTRVGHLIELAHSLAQTVIVDGVDSTLHLHLAGELGAQWVVGSQTSNLSISGPWGVDDKPMPIISPDEDAPWFRMTSKFDRMELLTA